MGETDDQRNVTRGPVKEIDVSIQAWTLGWLRDSDYILVFLCGPMLLGTVLELITNPAVRDYPSLIAAGIIAAVLSLGVHTGLRHAAVIDADVWRSDLIALPTILVLCVSIIGVGSIALSEANRLGVRIDDGVLRGIFYFFCIAAATLLGFAATLLLRRTRIVALGIPLVEILSRLRNERGMRALSATRVKRLDAPFGLVLVIVGFGLCLFAVGVGPPPKNLSGNLNSLYFFNLVGLCVLMRARRYFQVSADSLLSVDKRKPILFLRSFDDDEEDEMEKLYVADRAILDFSLEIRLSNHFTYFGPFIAIGSPKESVPQPGAARILLSEEAWQPRVISWMNEASLIIMYCGKSHWVNWELAKIIETERVTNLILMIPEIRKWSRRQRSQDVSTRIDRLREAFKDTKWRGSLASVQDFQDVRAMLFDEDGSMVVITSGPRNRESYHLAALIAHYIILNRTAN